ncbi:hypothetical protein EVAR_12338_1 [Eumeta japonica]|uniref:Uncharacterized protein n=1 Tax=Eumeta variegata TaxID=151549 RepID=A0A4C1X0R2_EUMVA|nr:hypothetical protein EVAR_12338_1 [Eumeta japonica]
MRARAELELPIRWYQTAFRMLRNDPDRTDDRIGSAATKTIIHDQLSLRKRCTRWTLHKLTDEQKDRRVDWCRFMIEKSDGAHRSVRYGRRPSEAVKKLALRSDCGPRMCDAENNTTGRRYDARTLGARGGGHQSSLELGDARSGRTPEPRPTLTSARARVNRDERAAKLRSSLQPSE